MPAKMCGAQGTSASSCGLSARGTCQCDATSLGSDASEHTPHLAAPGPAQAALPEGAVADELAQGQDDERARRQDGHPRQRRNDAEAQRRQQPQRRAAGAPDALPARVVTWSCHAEATVSLARFPLLATLDSEAAHEHELTVFHLLLLGGEVNSLTRLIFSTPQLMQHHLRTSEPSLNISWCRTADRLSSESPGA